MIDIMKKEYKTISLLVIVTGILYTVFTWQLPITDTVESNYALTALEMVRQEEWMSPIIYGKYWFDKPIFSYWMIIISYKLFGINEFAARVPSAVASIMAVIAMYIGMLKVVGIRRVAFISAAILGTAFQFWYISHAVLTDGHLLVFSLGTMLCAYEGLTKNSTKAMIGAYAFAGLAVLTKGPVGLVLPGFILLVFTLWKRKELHVKQLFNPYGIFAFIIVASPWYIWMYSVHGMSFVEGFLGLHNYVRATVPEHPEKNWWFMYIALWPITLLPWTGMTIYSLVKVKKDLWSQYLLTWGIGVILFYSLMATKYITYTYIALIPFVIITAHGIVALRNYYNNEKVPFKILAILAGPTLLLMVGLTIGLFFVPELRNKAWLTGVVGAFSIGLVISSLMKRRIKELTLSVICGMVLLYGVVPYVITPVLGDQSGKDVVAYLGKQGYIKDSSRKIYYYGEYRTSATYYMQDKVAIFIPYKDEGDVWDTGKNIMPVERWQDILVSNPTFMNVTIVVPERMMKYFMNTLMYQNMEVKQKIGKNLIFERK